MTPDTSNLKGGGVLIAAKSSIPWCSRTGRLFRPNPIEGKRGIAVRGSELCLACLNGAQLREAGVRSEYGKPRCVGQSGFPRFHVTTEGCNHTVR
jgi:hypothetical protein